MQDFNSLKKKSKNQMMRYVKVDRASEQTAHADNGQANCPNKTFSTTLIGMLVEYLN